MREGIEEGNRRTNSHYKFAGGKRWRNRKENRGWEALDKIARRKCWRKSGRESQEEIAGGNREKKIAGGKRGRNRKKNRGREVLEKNARRKCWRKMREEALKESQEESRERSAGETRKK